MKNLKARLNHQLMFDKDVKLPETKKECKKYFVQLTGELEPENLSCDGELSRTQTNQRLREIKATWKELEKIIGYKVSADQADKWVDLEYKSGAYS